MNTRISLYRGGGGLTSCKFSNLQPAIGFKGSNLQYVTKVAIFKRISHFSSQTSKILFIFINLGYWAQYVENIAHIDAFFVFEVEPPSFFTYFDNHKCIKSLHKQKCIEFDNFVLKEI